MVALQNEVALLLQPVRDFLPCATPRSWIDAALRHPDILLIDHANCERKAAATALSLMQRYISNERLLNKMSRLAREELRHFEQVLKLMKRRKVPYRPVSASRYASGLREAVRKLEPWRLVDTLIVGAYIEARSCERFAVLAPYVDEELGQFYLSLLKAEARHFEDYLVLAAAASPEPIDQRLAAFAQLEQQLIEADDTEFRFHSGPPVAA